jgi:hypothetical protein
MIFSDHRRDRGGVGASLNAQCVSEVLREVAVEEAVFGFTYILGPPETRRLQSQVQSGLNRMSHLNRKQPTGVSASEVSRLERWAVEKAWTVVVIATPAFCRSIRGQEVMKIRRNKRPLGVITLWKKRLKAGEAYLWSSSVDLDLPPQPDRDVVDKLIKQVSESIHRIEMVYATNRPRGPVGRTGLFAMLSYARKDDTHATKVREQLEREHITTWDYGDAPRKEMNYQDELAAKIKDARVVIFLLSKAWLQSEECQREARLAAQLDKRRLWLLCDDSPSPENAGPRPDCLDFRPRHRKKTLQQLAQKIFPSRRKKLEAGG